jgi:hypothetical protein
MKSLNSATSQNNKEEYSLEETAIIEKWGNPSVDNVIIAKGSYDPFTHKKESLLSLAINRRDSKIAMNKNQEISSNIK